MHEDDREPTAEQRRVALALEIDISGDCEAVAAARILDAIALAVGKSPKEPATDRQVEFAGTFGLDVQGDSKRVADARIRRTLLIQNQQALKQLRLAPGAAVVREQSRDEEDSQILCREWGIVSSISKDGRVYFKGGNGRGAWARHLRHASPEEEAILRADS